MSKENDYQFEDSYSIGLVEISRLSELDRQIFLVAGYLEQQNIIYGYDGTIRFISSEDIKKHYKRIYKKDISIETVCKTMKNLIHTDLIYQDEELIYMPDRILLHCFKNSLQYTPVEDSGGVLSWDISTVYLDDTKTTIYQCNPISQRVLQAVYYNDNRACFYRAIFDENEKVDIGFREFSKMKFGQKYKELERICEL